MQKFHFFIPDQRSMFDEHFKCETHYNNYEIYEIVKNRFVFVYIRSKTYTRDS